MATLEAHAPSQRAAVVGAIALELAGLDVGHPVRVAVDGITAAGKTTFADDLAEAVRDRGRTCMRVSMDGFHYPQVIRYRQGRESAAGYYEDAYDFEALRRELLDPLGPHGDLRYRTAVIDLANDEAVEDPHQQAQPDLVLVVDGSFLQRAELDGAWDRSVYLASTFERARRRGVERDAAQFGSPEEAERIYRERYHRAQERYLTEATPESRAGIVVDHDDPALPVIRSHQRPVTARPDADDRIAETQAFFGSRAERWNDRFAEDAPAFARAVGELRVEAGDTALDVGCGAGRALLDLAHAVGPSGSVIGVDLTPEMVAAAHRLARGAAQVAVGDARDLPIAAGACDVIFAAGLVNHLPNPVLGLVELARVARPGTRLAVFHPVGRAALAHKHGHSIGSDDVLDPANLAAGLAASGWSLTSVDDGPDRYLALATLDAASTQSSGP